MKHISKYKLLLVIALWATFSSCEKSYLELVPTTSLTPDQALAKEADLQVALRGAYAGLRGVDLLGRTVPVIGDVMADNAYQSLVNTNRYTLFNNYTFNITDANASGLWATAYTVILRANQIINSPVAANTNVNQYKGEAYAIRALCYFELAKFFAVPYTESADALCVPIVTVYNSDLKPARAKNSEVYNLMISDLDKAYSLMTAFTNSSQFSKYAAKALQAKIYLSKGDKASAKTAALDVITNSGFTAVTAANHAAYWASGAVRTDKVETLFEVSSDATANLAFDALSYLYSQSGNYGDLLCSDDLYASFAVTDVRRSLYPTGTRGGVPSVFVAKYPVISGDVNDTKVVRLSEMYLIAAEGSLPADETSAKTYLNTLTALRGATAIASTGTQLFEDVITERRKELAFEGERYNDLQRLKRAVTRSANYPSTARSIEYGNFRRILPIPQVEVDANPAIRVQQNPGY
jgi:hypothetical protein